MHAGQNNESGGSAAAGGGASIGARLAAARETRELTVERIAASLHLEPRIVEAMERDDHAVLPEPAYVKGYLRGYAQLVGLPADELVREYKELTGEPPPLTVVRVQQNAPFFRLPSARVLRNVILLLLAAILLWLSYPFVAQLLDRRMHSEDLSRPGRLELPPAIDAPAPDSAPPTE